MGQGHPVENWIIERALACMYSTVCIDICMEQAISHVVRLGNVESEDCQNYQNL